MTVTVVPGSALLGIVLHGAGDFSWTRFEIHPSVLIGCTLFFGAYLAAIGPLRRRLGGPDHVRLDKLAYMLSGVLVLFVSLSGPIHDLSDNYLFSAHMVQHMLITLIVPPLFLLGTPDWLMAWLLRPRIVERTAKFLTMPLVAYAVYNLVFVGWHFPVFYNWALVDHNVHIVQHLMFIAAAMVMWWPIASPLPDLYRLSRPGQLLYIFAFGIPMSVVSAFITFSETVLYTWYEAAPRLWDLSALDDQRLGGVIMWVPGMLVFWTAMTFVFFRWARSEERKERQAARRMRPTGEHGAPDALPARN